MFYKLKETFMQTSVLVMFNWNYKIILKTNAFNYVSAEVLSQFNNDDILKLFAFISKKHSIMKSNNKIYNKKLLVIIRCFEKWQSELKEFSSSVKIITDHKNLKYFMFTKLLNWCQACWSKYLFQFQFKICY